MTRIFEHKENLLGYDDLEVIESKEVGRRYVSPSSNKYPSITTVLSILSEDHIKKWRERVGEEEANKISYRASTRGTAVHAIIEDYINNKLQPNRFMPNILANFKSVQPILDERIGTVYAQEAALYSDYLGVAGRVDCVAEFDGKLSIIDFKTSKKPKKPEWIENYFIQETFYAIAWEERTKLPITQLVTIIAVDNEPPQVFIEHRDNWDDKLLETIREYKRRNGIE